jgi:hypothetical protein
MMTGIWFKIILIGVLPQRRCPVIRARQSIHGRLPLEKHVKVKNATRRKYLWADQIDAA